jgi:hypothetical protein
VEEQLGTFTEPNPAILNLSPEMLYCIKKTVMKGTQRAPSTKMDTNII